MKSKTLFCLLTAFLMLSSSAMADQLSPDNIINTMIASMERATISDKININTTKDGETVGRLVAGVARKGLPDGHRTLIVLLEPEGLKGVAYLYHRQKDFSIQQWIYAPYLGRVRKISGYSINENFIGTDFTIGDLTFSFHQKGKNRLIGRTTLEGKSAFKIETVLKENGYLYSRIVTWVSTSTFLPIRLDYYNTSGRLWKQQLYNNITIIDGHPAAFSVRMEDLLGRTGTQIVTFEVNTDSGLVTDDVFSPEQLAQSLNCPIWEKVCVTPAQP